MTAWIELIGGEEGALPLAGGVAGRGKRLREGPVDQESPRRLLLYADIIPSRHDTLNTAIDGALFAQCFIA